MNYGQTLLVVGGTGSFGRAFIAAMLRDEPCTRLISFSRNAEMRYRLEQAHLDAVRGGRLLVVPGDVRHAEDLARLDSEGIDTIVHAAAEKHIGTGQRFRSYTRSVNYGGACRVRDFALRAGVKRVLALSTDKACRPIANYYGWTKAAAEQMFVRANRKGGCRFSLVRYGNVIASSGSVVPAFFEQRKLGVLAVTDPRMTRFAMPLDKDGSNGVQVFDHAGPVVSAVDLVRIALRLMRGGEIFVPQIPSHGIRDLAAAVGPSCRVEITGVRAGERLYEALISPDEAARTWTVPGLGWVILPTAADVWSERVPPGFTFRSDSDPLPVQWEERRA